MIRLPNLIIPFGTQHRPNAAWIMEAGSSFQLCSIDFWQVCSYRWLCFSIMIIEISVKKSLGFFFFFLGSWNGTDILFNFMASFFHIVLFQIFFFFQAHLPLCLIYEKWLMHWVSTICITFSFAKQNCHLKVHLGDQFKWSLTSLIAMSNYSLMCWWMA